MQPLNQSKALVKGALVLTVAALITKILSAAYRIPFQNIVGDTGFYIYQQVYPIYGVALVLSTTGFPIVISKLYTEQKTKEDQQRLIVVSSLFLLILGVFSFSLLYIGAEWLANLMNDPSLALLIKVISIMFLTIPFTSLLRGYYQGEGYMIPTAFSQVGEQLIRVGTILTTAFLFIRANYNLYEVGAGGVFGSITGGIVGAVILITFAWIKKDYQNFQFKKLRLWGKESSTILKTLFIQGFAICISSMLLLLIQLADSLNLYSLLISTGINGEDAKVLKGIYDRGQPLIQLGAVVATSMSLSLVPLIASERVKNSANVLHEKIHLALRVSLTIGLGAAVGLMTIIKPTNRMLFENGDGSNVLAVLSMAILLGSVIITLVAIFQGLGYTLFPAIVVLCGFTIKIILNIILVPSFGTFGAAWASNGALACIFIALFIKLRFIMKNRVMLLNFLMKIILSAVIMYIVLKGFTFLTDYLYSFGFPRLISSIQALSGVIIGGFTYMLIVIRTKVFTVEELTLLPFGSKIMYLFPSRKRR
jgi:O-antigen/teichoic acid export membrane protein